MESLNKNIPWGLAESGKRKGKDRIKEKDQIETEVLTTAEQVTMLEYEKGQARDNTLSIDNTEEVANDDTKDKDRIVSYCGTTVVVVAFKTTKMDRRRSEKARERWRQLVGEVLSLNRRHVKTLWALITLMRITARTLRAAAKSSVVIGKD